jgi:hypothetical protein
MSFPQTPHTLVLRTAFDDDGAWQAVCDEIRTSSCEGYVAPYSCVSDAAWADVPYDRLAAFAPPPRYFLVADRMTFEHPEHPILALNLAFEDEGPRAFRLISAQVCAFVANMETANMYFFEFAESEDADGIFRGFRDG